VVINEILYRARYYNIEFVELKNNLYRALDLSGWRLENEAHEAYVLPRGSIVEPLGYLVLSRDTRAVFEYYNIVNLAATDLPFSLDNGDDTLSLFDASGELVDIVTYEDDPPWPLEPDGGGPSLELIDPRAENEPALAWAASASQGTPGRPNSVAALEVPPQPSSGERPLFHRGDVDASGDLQLTDAVSLLGYLFLGGEAPRCAEAADSDNSGVVDITDALTILNYLFMGGLAPAPPGPPGAPCGTDPDEPGSPGDLGCEEYPACESGDMR
jgi:hypothetical protein